MKCLIYLAVVISCLLISIHETQTASVLGSKRSETIAYLKEFGYLPEAENNEKISDEKFVEALKKLQKYGHILATGKIDDDTINLLRRPRCGVPDDAHLRTNHHRQKRYDWLSSKWHKNHITWSLDAKPFQKEENKILIAIREAFNIWMEHSMLTFSQIKEFDDADIRISFQSAKHRDLDPYDLDGTTLAHAFQPGDGIHGDAHFKKDVQWDFDVLANENAAEGKTSFFSVALHELGHSLGMGHSEYEDAVMYQYSLGAGKLSKDDIKGIQHIYGVPKSTSAEPTKEPLPPNKNDEEDDDRPIWDTRPLRNKTDDTPDRCSTSYDAIAMIRKELFIFKDKYFWRPNSSDNETVEIHQFFSGLPSNLSQIDAVYENSEGKTLFFINQKLYIFEYRTLETEVPLARVGLSGIQKVDKIFKWPYNNIVYLFSGDFYWRYDEKFNVILKNSKRVISRVFKDTYDTDTALVMNKTLYFFKGLYYYAFDDRSMTMQRMKPMVSAAEFMGCNLPKVPPKVEMESRFGEGGFDELIELEAQELPEDDDNPEKIDKKDEPDSAIALHYILSLAIACFITSYSSSSILLN